MSRVQAGSRAANRGRRKSVRQWHLVTNHQNMLFILAAGLVMSPSGFRGKYYCDSLNLFPGWIPLFTDKIRIPSSVFQHATAERKYLRPCVASFELSELSGSIRVLSADGSIRDASFPIKRIRKKDIAVLVRAPLPASLVSSISFRSDIDLLEFKRVADDVSNVDTSFHLLSVAEARFSGSDDSDWMPNPSQDETPGVFDDRVPSLGQAVGGALAMLYLLANRSEHGLMAFRSATEKQVAESRSSDHSLILSGLDHCFVHDETSGPSDERSRFFWGVVNSMVTAQSRNGVPTSIDFAVNYVSSQIATLSDGRLRERMQLLVDDMRGCLGLGKGSNTELFERHRCSLSRSLLLFCLRESCSDLLAFSHDHLNDADYILAGVLFGVRDGWLGLPVPLRDRHVSAYISVRMAEAELGALCGSVQLKPPPRPVPLRELFSLSEKGWSQSQRDAAHLIAKECRWNECYRSSVWLADGTYPEAFRREDLSVPIVGRVLKFDVRVEETAFLDRLGRWPLIDPHIEMIARETLIPSNTNVGRVTSEAPECV